MANQPHPDRKAVTWRLHCDLVSRVQRAAAARGETAIAFVTRALTRELDDPTRTARTDSGPVQPPPADSQE